MIAPDRIWHEVVTTNNMAELSVFGTRPDDWNSENFIEYARVTPDPIPLPRAEVEALMETITIQCGLLTMGCGGAQHRIDIVAARIIKALTALQERMK